MYPPGTMGVDNNSVTEHCCRIYHKRDPVHRHYTQKDVNNIGGILLIVLMLKIKVWIITPPNVNEQTKVITVTKYCGCNFVSTGCSMYACG